MENKGIIEKKQLSDEQNEELKKRINELKTSIAKVFASEDGFTVLRFLAANCLPFTSSFDSSSDRSTCINEGKKIVFLKLFEFLDITTQNRILNEIFHKGDR